MAIRKTKPAKTSHQLKLGPLRLWLEDLEEIHFLLSTWTTERWDSFLLLAADDSSHDFDILTLEAEVTASDDGFFYQSIDDLVSNLHPRCAKLKLWADCAGATSTRARRGTIVIIIDREECAVYADGHDVKEVVSDVTSVLRRAAAPLPIRYFNAALLGILGAIVGGGLFFTHGTPWTWAFAVFSVTFAVANHDGKFFLSHWYEPIRLTRRRVHGTWIARHGSALWTLLIAIIAAAVGSLVTWLLAK